MRDPGLRHLRSDRRVVLLADLGTGEAVRSPSLMGLQARAPYLHTGELVDFARVTGTLHSAHGRVDLLSMREKESLITYLQSL